MAININLPSVTQSYTNLASFPSTGSVSILYKALNNNKLYTWDGSKYNEIDKRLASSWGSVSAAPETTSVTKDEVGLGNVDNTSDVDKPISTATQTALNAKQATLVSGTNIKTINGSSVLGSGDLTISSGSSANPSVIAVNIPDGTTVSGATLTISKSLFIPANTIATNAILQLNWGVQRLSGIIGTVVNQVYINTTNSLTGATLVAIGGNLNTTQSYVNCSRDIQKVGTTAKTSQTTQQVNDGSISLSINTFTLNNSTDLYMIFACNGGASDTSVIRQVRLTQYT
jgi:hypothetical protein